MFFFFLSYVVSFIFLGVGRIIMLDPITTVETPMRLMCFASWMISDAVCDAEYCWQMSFSPICRNTMSHSGSKFFTTWRSKCFNEWTCLPPTPCNLVSIVLDSSDFVLSIHDSSLLIKLCSITSTLGLLTDNDIVDVNC